MQLTQPDGTASKWFPLRLCEVLEREFVVTHGPLASPRNWLLERGDISFVALAGHLLGAESEAIGPVSDIREKLQRTGFTIPADNRWSQESEQHLVGLLNDALRTPEYLYDPQLLEPDTEASRLAEIWATRADLSREDAGSLSGTRSDLGALPRDRHPKPLASDSEQVLLNRLLLEAAFPPDTIARTDTRRLSLLFDDIRNLRGSGGIYSALCLSGGGIRSAAFSLGVVQGLARCGLLDKFDFLSTVSGGGYLGSWLSTWVHRHPQGLPGVVRELASRHGGTVRVSSKGEGRGAEFVIALPRSPPAQRVCPQSVQPPPRPIGIFLVDDNEDSARSLGDLLELDGHRVEIFTDPRAALEALQQRQPALLISDIGLPGMTGYDLIRAIRRSERETRLFAVAMTGYAQPNDRARALEAGFDAHLPKPPSFQELSHILVRAWLCQPAEPGS